MDRFDVAIIGAGVYGSSAAYHLASRGVRTVVFEREAPALGPTGRSSGICRAYYTNPFLARMAWESIGMLRRFEEITGGHDAGFRETGFLFLQRDEHRAQVSEVLGRLTEIGIGVEVPLTVERHVVAMFRWGRAEPVVAHADIEAGYYFRPEGSEQFLMGSLHPAPQVDPDSFPQEVGASEVLELSEPLVRRVPHLAGAEPQGGWASLYDVSPDWQPVIGEVAPGVFVDAGTSGHGFKLAPALGRRVAELVTGEAVDPDLRQFDPFRFERGAVLSAGFGRSRIVG